jgi:hypothetical protein
LIGVVGEPEPELPVDLDAVGRVAVREGSGESFRSLASVFGNAASCSRLPAVSNATA